MYLPVKNVREQILPPRTEPLFKRQSSLIFQSKLRSENESRLQTAQIYEKFPRVITVHKFDSTTNSIVMQGKSDSSCFSLSEQRKFRFVLVCLLVQKFGNLRFPQELNSGVKLSFCCKGL